MDTEDSQHKPTEGSTTDLERGRARRFLRRLAKNPFVAVVVTDGDTINVYLKGMDRAEALRAIEQAIKEAEDD